MGKFWKKEEIEHLINNYEKNDLSILSKELNRSVKSISQKAFKLGIKRDENIKKNAVVKTNKIKGRDLSYERLKEISAKYVTYSEFIKNDYSAYLAIKKYGYLELFDNLLYSNISLPQLILKNIMNILLNDVCRYNDRKTIKPYELDLYYNKYNLAFEYNGSYWHLENDKDEIKQKLCKDKNITLITIIENSRDYITDIKNQLINNLSLINKVTNKKISKKDILKINVDLDKLNVFGKNSKDFFSSYVSLKEFKKENYSLYRKLKKYNLIDKYLKHLI